MAIRHQFGPPCTETRFDPPVTGLLHPIDSHIFTLPSRKTVHDFSVGSADGKKDAWRNTGRSGKSSQLPRRIGLYLAPARR